MTFVHGYLLAGLVALGVPILIHLLNRQKPQQLPFPAFRFLKLKRSTNRRKLRLQNLLLLLARLLVLLLIVLALARPRLTGSESPLSGTRPVLAVLIFDTSPSMGYATANESRLDDTRARVKELLDEFAPESKIRVLETGEPLPGLNDVEGWLQGRALVEARVSGLRTQPVIESLPRLVEGGVALLARMAQDDNKPRVLVVFGDRTAPSWPGGALKPIPEEVKALFIDVGIEKPRDLAIESIETRPTVVVAGSKLEIVVHVRATGADFNTELKCELEGDPAPAQSPQNVRLSDGQRGRYVFHRVVPARPDAPDAPVQIRASLAGSDPLAFNNSASATVPVRTKRKLLLVAGNAQNARYVRLALQTIAADRPADAFAVTQTTPADAAKPTANLGEYDVVILHQVVKVPPGLWPALGTYVENGGGLILIPDGDDLVATRDEFNDEAGQVQLLPGKLKQLIKVPPNQPGVPWAEYRRGHPLTQQFLDWQRGANVDFNDPKTRPFVFGYWEVDAPAEAVVAAYADKDQRPALLEKRRGRGKVLLFTLPLDGRKLDDLRGWHNYWSDSSFGQVLLDQSCQYLAGRVNLPSLNFKRGQEVRVALPVPLPAAPYKLTGPGLSESETRVTWNAPANAGTPGVPIPDLLLPQATSTGNYQLRDNKDRPFLGFSIMELPDENNLARVPSETIEAVLGEKTVVPVGHNATLKGKLGESFAPPTELLPVLLLGLLAFLVLESWLANRYYKPTPEAEEQARTLRPTGELTRSRI